MQFHKQGDDLYYWIPDTKRELANNTDFGSDHVRAVSAPAPEQVNVKRRSSMKRSAAMLEQLVVSRDAQHSAKEVCESDSSHGPDFVSVPEKLFCDMGTKTLWLFCEDDKDQGPCFDIDTKQLRGTSIVGRDVESTGYSRVTEWE